MRPGASINDDATSTPSGEQNQVKSPVRVGEASHPGPEFRRLRRGSVRNVVPRVGDVTDDEDDIPLSAIMIPVTQPVSFGPMWIDSPEERIVARSEGSHFQ